MFSSWTELSPSWYSLGGPGQCCLWLESAPSQATFRQACNFRQCNSRVQHAHKHSNILLLPPPLQSCSLYLSSHLHSIQTYKEPPYSHTASIQSFSIKHTFYHLYQTIFKINTTLFKVSPFKTTVYQICPPQSPSIESPSSAKMPSFITSRHVLFDPNPAYSRPAHDDEAYVMKAWTRHTSNCGQCARPYELYKLGGTLCQKGQQRARDVANYLFNKEGDVYSLVDQERRQSTRVEIPAGCDSVRDLLKALERGFLQQSQTPLPSYDRTYFVAPRRRRTQPRTDEPRHTRKDSQIEIVDPAPSFYTREIPRKQPLGRGSLFEEDMRDRESRRESVQPIYYTAAPKKKPVVSARHSTRHWKTPEPSFLRVFPKISSKQASHGPFIKIPPARSINLDLITLSATTYQHHHHPLARQDTCLCVYTLRTRKRPPGRMSSVPQEAGNWRISLSYS